MVYRRTAKYSAQRQRAMQSGRSRARLERTATEYPNELPDLRMRITIERFDFGTQTHVFELRKSRRVDSYRVFVDGAPWRTCGLSRVLESIRKALPRTMSARNL